MYTLLSNKFKDWIIEWAYYSTIELHTVKKAGNDMSTVKIHKSNMKSLIIVV